jgi:UDP-3-O-[3-hydroxymyristoyl] glucosamine N-acyltransferase
MTLSVQELARICGLQIIGGDPATPIHSAANLAEAGPNQLGYVTNAKLIAQAQVCRASALIVPATLATLPVPASTSLLVSEDPDLDFIKCLGQLYPESRPAPGVHARANVDPSATVGAGTFIDANVTVCRGARIGRDCRLHAGAYVGENVELGDGCVLYPNVVLYAGTVLRENVVIHSGTVIGADGFGYKTREGVHIKFPQVGTVLIERDVEIGANTCIDRSALGQTVVGTGTKIDNLVQIGHNVKLGRGVLICGQVGIGGSTVIEDYVTLISQSGVADHLRIGTGSRVFAQSGVIGNLPPNSEVMGFPAAERMVVLREIAVARRLAAIYRPLKLLVELLPQLTERFRSGKA